MMSATGVMPDHAPMTWVNAAKARRDGVRVLDSLGA